MWAKTLFLVGGGLAFALALGGFLDEGVLADAEQGISESLQVVYATLLGFVAPGPRYIIYPVLAKLNQAGLGTAAIISMICGHVLIEPSTAMLEAGFFGWRFPAKRFVVSLVITLAAGWGVLLLAFFGVEIGT